MVHPRSRMPIGRTLFLISLLAVFVLLLAACGGGRSGDEARRRLPKKLRRKNLLLKKRGNRGCRRSSAGRGRGPRLVAHRRDRRPHHYYR